MNEILIELFKPTPQILTISEIKKALENKNVSNQELRLLERNLRSLELDGKIYYDVVNNNYCIFPSDFFVSKIKQVKENTIKFAVNGEFYELKTDNPDAVKKAFIIVKKDGDHYKLVKVIGKEQELENKEELEKIYELFNPYNKKFTFKELLRITKVDKSTLERELKKLELQGLLYYDGEEDTYKTMPNNYFISSVDVSKKGFFIVYHNGVSYNLFDTYGILPFDTVLFKRENKKISVVKIIKRGNPDLVLEVTKDKQIKVVGNNIKVRCLDKEFNDLQLPEGTRFLGAISCEEINGIYDITFKEVLGHKNDLNAELEAIAINNGFKTRYTKEELEQAYASPTEIKGEEKEDYEDLTKERIFTIDGAHTKDMDDAVGIKKLDNGNYELTVSIAHVSKYINPYSPLYERAIHNTTSVYMIDSVNHMLHPQVSNGICSLNEGVDRLTKTYKMIIDKKGNVLSFNFFNAIINSKKKMTYEDVNEFLEDDIIISGYEEYTEDLLLMQELAQIIANKRQNNGAVDFGNHEIEYIFDDEGTITDIKARHQGPAEKIIENFMIITNESVADFMYNLGIDFVYRNHEIPFDDKVKDTVNLIKTMGYHVNAITNSDDPHSMQRLIASLSTQEEFFILSSLLLRSMQKAYFSTENKGHYGLASKAYSQTTSPIRRLMDLIIEYILDNIEHIYDGSLNLEEYKEDLDELCKRASMMERCADKAEYEANKLYMIDYCIKHKEDVFHGFVQEITPRYIVVKTKELIEGIIYLYNIDDGNYRYNPDCRWLENTIDKHHIIIGSKITLNFKDADREYRILEFYGNTKELEKGVMRRRESK